MAEILRRASEDAPDVPEPAPGDDTLTLHEIERIALDVGIDPSRVRSAALAIPSELPDAPLADRVHLATIVPGSLGADALRTVADHLRSTIGTGQVRMRDGSLSFDAENEEYGKLTVEVRAAGSDVAVSAWSERATSRRGAIGGGAIFGAIIGGLAAAALQPVFLEFLGVTAAVTAGGAGVGLSIWKSTGRRWQQRLGAAHAALVARAAALVSQPREGRVEHLPPGDDGGR